MSEPSPLDDDLQALLEAERRAPLREDLPEIRARARENVLARTSGGGGPGGWGPAGATLMGLAVGLGLGGLGAGGLFAAWLATRAPVSIPVPVPVVVAVPTPVSVPEPPALPLPAPVRAPDPAPTTLPEPAPAPEPVPALEQAPEQAPEQALVERARVALLRGDPTEALVTLMGHERQFPRSSLTEEREVLVIEALAALGRRDEALERSARFRERYPASVHLPSLPPQGASESSTILPVLNEK